MNKKSKINGLNIPEEVITRKTVTSNSSKNMFDNMGGISNLMQFLPSLMNQNGSNFFHNANSQSNSNVKNDNPPQNDISEEEQAVIRKQSISPEKIDYSAYISYVDRHNKLSRSIKKK